MKIGRNLPRGRANEENQQELERMRRRDLNGSTPESTGNPWDALTPKHDQVSTSGRGSRMHLDWGHVIVLLVIAAALFLAACFVSSAHAEEALFSEGATHVSTPEYALYFRTVSATDGPLTLSIRDSLYDPEQAASLLSTVTDDLALLSGLTGIPVAEFHPHTVYVGDRLVNGSIERLGSRIYVKADDIAAGTYRPLLICAALGTEDYWLGVGLDTLLSGTPTDDLALCEAFASAESLDMLSLSVPFFIADFATADEIHLARQTAASVCRYALDAGGIPLLLDSDPITLRQDWLHHIGTNRPYTDPAPLLLRQYVFRPSAQYSFIAVDRHGNTIYVKPMPDMVSAADVQHFLLDVLAAPDALFTLLAHEAPEHLAGAQNRYAKLRIYCGESSGSWSIPEYREIRLALAAGFFHEVGHVLFPTPNGANAYSTMWQYEGLCDYLRNDVYPFHAWQQQLMDALMLFSAMDNPQTPNHRFMKRAVGLYLQHDTSPSTLTDIDIPFFRHAMALVPVIYPADAEGSDWAATITSFYPALKAANGNELTYEQAYSFTAWLIGEYSLSTFLTYCTEGESFDEAFDIPYESARTEWLSWLSSLLVP